MKLISLTFGYLVFCVLIVASPCGAGDPMPAGDDLIGKYDNGTAGVLYSQSEDEQQMETDEGDEYYDDSYLYEEEPQVTIADPLEPVNRFFFQFNDKLYFWVFKPVAQGYAAIVPEPLRISVKNVFNNISTPVRVVNSLLQMKVKAAGKEMLRFGINTTVGMLGLYDAAKTEMDISMSDEDLGQTLGVWGMGPVMYINWPFLGPSTVRDSLGLAGDSFLEPLDYVHPFVPRMAVRTGGKINNLSLSIGDYEGIKKDALDPYEAIKDIYIQYRKNKIAK